MYIIFGQSIYTYIDKAIEYGCDIHDYILPAHKSISTDIVLLFNHIPKLYIKAPLDDLQKLHNITVTVTAVTYKWKGR